MYGLFGLLRNLLIMILVITILRSVIGVVMKFLGNVVSTHGPHQASRPNGQPVAITGELFKDPVCGTFVASSTEFQRIDGKQHFYYCSQNCRSQHALTPR